VKGKGGLPSAPYGPWKRDAVLLMKRMFDLIGALSGLVLLFPLLSFIAILVKLTSKGPMFYRGIRSGLHGVPFRIFKFRTMVPDAELQGGPSTALNDPRFTSIGRLLRKYKLDELPQLINILKREMSIVGPRPQVEKYTKLYTGENSAILSVRPGLTDYASIHFMDMDATLGDEDVDRKYLEEVEPYKNQLRVKYVKEQSFRTDMKILFRTVFKLLGS
jgi:lipopolysaccharide/colanic/teichoic acid biosynthesis glycosyltransferase